MATPWKYCPLCAEELAFRNCDGEQKLACSKCEFVHWDSPVPVVATLIPMDEGIVLVKRGIQPFVGQWCLPRGFMRSCEIPKRAAVRETLEETGLKVWLVRMINSCNPSPPGITLNQVTMFYLARRREGQLHAGSDAQEVRVFKRDELPEICFGSDRMIVNDWFEGKLGSID